MVLLTMTLAIVEAVHTYNANPPSLPNPPALTSEPSLENAAVGNPISHFQIIEMSKYLREQYAAGKRLDLRSERLSYHLDELLRGSKIYTPPAPPKAEPVGRFISGYQQIADG